MKKKGMVFLYIISVLLVCGIISFAAMSFANDAFALCKTGEKRSFILTEDTKISDAAKKLGEEGIISYPFVFSLYMRLKGDTSPFPAGEYELSPSMSYDEIRYEIFGIGKPRSQIRITVPEGYTTDEIIELFVTNGIGSKEGFTDVIQNYGFDFSFLSLIPENSNRKYRLDGYLFPDTYMFYSDSSESEVISKMLSNFERKFTSAMISDAASMGYTVDEAVTIASMIQSEAYYLSDMAGISSVFRNRLRSGMKYLQSDATALYGDAYDTYKNAGLPPGPISNPGLAALDAAVYPSRTGYYYFLTGKDKKAVFSRTYSEHRHAIEKIKKE